MILFNNVIQCIIIIMISLTQTAYARVFWNNLFRDKSLEPSQRCPCTCGLTNRRQRLVGGDTVEFNEYPWTVSLLYKGHFYCGGTLISNRYVLTAGHCVQGVHVNSLAIIVGDHLRSFPIETKSKRYKAVYSIIHPQFNRTTYNNDIALVKLGQAVPYKWYARPACLPQPVRDYVGNLAQVTGWGRQDEDKHPSDYLKEITVPVLSNSVCKSLRYKTYDITDNMLCAGYVNGGKDSCSGDSGGPLLWEGQDKKVDVIGIVSWGNGCGREGYPGVYTRVSRYLRWIQEHTRDSCYCGRREGRG